MSSWSHYKKVSLVYDSSYFHSSPYYVRQITEHIAPYFTQNRKNVQQTRILDVGAGTGSFGLLISFLLDLQVPVLCIEPSQEMAEFGRKKCKNLNTLMTLYDLDQGFDIFDHLDVLDHSDGDFSKFSKILIPKSSGSDLSDLDGKKDTIDTRYQGKFKMDWFVGDSLDFMQEYKKSNNSQKFDIILFKGSIHHIEMADISTIFSFFYSILDEGGLIVIETRANGDFPWFQKAQEMWEKSLAKDELIEIIGNQGFKVTSTVKEISGDIPRDWWFQMLRNRFWSHMATLTDQEIEEGLKEISNMQNFNYKDKIRFIVCEKNK